MLTLSHRFCYFLIIFIKVSSLHQVRLTHHLPSPTKTFGHSFISHYKSNVVLSHEPVLTQDIREYRMGLVSDFRPRHRGQCFMGKGFSDKKKSSPTSQTPVSYPDSSYNVKPAVRSTSKQVEATTSSEEDLDSLFVNHFPTLNTSYQGIKILHNDPPVIEVKDFLSLSECDKYIASAETLGYQIPSQTFNAGAGSTRTSTTWFMNYASVDEFVNKTVSILNWPQSRFEEPQVVRYEFGQQVRSILGSYGLSSPMRILFNFIRNVLMMMLQFSWHYDAIPKSMQTSSGQRLATVIVYLNEVKSSGGATVFKVIHIVH